MNWTNLQSIAELDELEKRSFNKNVLIFKHSTRCSISTMAKNRLERDWVESAKIEPFYLDLLNFRAISDEIAKRYQITHQSPQIILLKDGKPLYNASHSEIKFEAIADF